MIAIKKRDFFRLITFATGLIIGFSSLAAEGDETKAPAAPAASAVGTREAIDLASPQERRIQALITSISINRAHEVETIESPNDQFLALFRESTTGDPQGCILLLHGNNEHPDWPQVISPIRNQLINNSWCTLSIEIPDTTKRFDLPSLPDRNDTAGIAATNNPTENSGTSSQEENKTLPNESVVFNRIELARQHLQDKGYNRLVFLGHGTGGAYALKYVVDNNISSSALVLIEPISPPPFSDYEVAELIEPISLPILDYYFDSNEKENRFAKYRASAAKKRTSKANAYIQIQAPPNRRYGMVGEKRLTQRVWGFLKQNTHQSDQTRPLPNINKSLFSEDPLQDEEA